MFYSAGENLVLRAYENYWGGQANQTPLASSTSDTSLELIGYRVDALPTTSRPLQVTLFWRAVRPAAEDWTAFFHLTPHGKNAELLGKWTS